MADHQNAFAPYAELVARKPENGVEKLGMERLGELLSSDLPSRFEALTQQDEDAAGHLKTLTDVERRRPLPSPPAPAVDELRFLLRLLRPSRPTTFQIGTLFIDAEVAISACAWTTSPTTRHRPSRAISALPIASAHASTRAKR